MSAPAAVVSSYARLKTLADGTLQLTLNVEPNDAATAFAMCDRPGASIVLTRITNEAAQAAQQSATAGEPRTAEDEAVEVGGAHSPARFPASSTPRAPLRVASKIALTCSSPSFHRFLDEVGGDLGDLHDTIVGGMPDAGDAARAEETVKAYCGVTRKRDVEGSPIATNRWAAIEESFFYWQRRAA